MGHNTPGEAGGTDRRATASLLRERLQDVIQRSGLNQAQFARALKVDRSTLVQILSPATDRLPRAETLAHIAQLGHVSLDWLLGVTPPEQPCAPAALDSVEIAPDAASPIDGRLMKWHREAAGYKIRHVAVTFPDLLKTDEIVAFEYGKSVHPDLDGAIEAVHAHFSYLRRPEIEFEASNSIQAITLFAAGQGVWRGLSVAARRRQLEHLIDLCNELYPTFRWFLFDEREVYSAPITIFGPLRAAIYTGQGYLVVSAPQHVQALARQFDRLIRAAVVQPADVTACLTRLLRDLEHE
jgi:transcriptional regulator with XRE-family HTH domain